MAYQTLPSISVATANRKRTLKNKSGRLSTTMDFGSVLVGKCQRIYADSNFQISERERVYLTSLVSPNFSGMKLKGYNMFVPFSDITQNYAPLMAQKEVARGNNIILPLREPNVPNNDLSFAVLFGAQLTIYKYNSGNTAAELMQIPASTPWGASSSSLPQEMQDAFSDLDISRSSMYGLSNPYRLRVRIFTGDSTDSVGFALSNPNPCSFFDYRTNNSSGDEQFGMDDVTLKGADYLIPVTHYTSGVADRRYLLAFRLSSFGRRLRKNLIGCGWQFNLSITDPVKVYPLIATYKAYFQLFAPKRFMNYESTVCYQLQQWYDLTATPDLRLWKNGTTSPESSLFRSFLFQEFGMTFYTDDMDFVAAHTRDLAVSPAPSTAGVAVLDGLQIDVSNGAPVITPVGSASDPADLSTAGNGHSFINNVFHSQLDSELLKRLYLWTNRNTQAGARIAELLRAQGLGAWVDEHRSNFISKFEIDLEVYDVPAQSDTYNEVTGQGQRTGEYGARGIGSGGCDPESFETMEDGYLITLLVIVPVGAYAESIDPDLWCIDKFAEYNPDFDSLGMQFDRKSDVHGSMPWADDTGLVGSLGDSFGAAPMYFNKKFGRSVMNGDFTLRSTRDSYMTWNLEKVMLVGEHDIGSPVQVPASGSAPARTSYDISIQSFTPNDVPIAGEVWRYPTRYEWITRFNRIFYNDSSTGLARKALSLLWRDPSMFEYFSLRDDNFIVHMVFDLPVYDKMLPVQDSFETTDDTHHANSSIVKA